jgi:hypothetical protein
MSKLRSRLTYANVTATLALVIAVAGGTAYAANTIGTSDVIDNSLLSADLKNNAAVRSADVVDDNLSGGGLRGVDIANAAGGSDNVNADKLDGLDSSELLQGSGRLLAARFIMLPGQPDRTLFEIPGLGRLYATCGHDYATVVFRNTTSRDVDLWVEDSKNPYHEIETPGIGQVLVVDVPGYVDDAHASTVAVGYGDDPGARTTTVVHPFASQAGVDAPCTFQAQGILWTAE